MGVLGFLQRLFSGEGIVKAVKELEEPVGIFGDFVTSFFAGVEEEEKEVIERRRVQQVFEPELPEPPEVKEEIFIRKIVKTGKSKEGNRNLFAYTYEANEINREFVLVQAINDEFDVDIRKSIYGYEDFEITDKPPIIWPGITTGKE